MNENDPEAEGNDSPEDFELVVKFSGGCEAKTQGLVAEVLAAVFAADLDLPVCEPFIVYLEPEFVKTIPDPEIRELAMRSSKFAFGSRKLPPQFSTLLSGVAQRQETLTKAAEILAFDIMIANPDRRTSNPNCLQKADELAIYDHELAFLTEGVFLWQPPWESGGLPFANGESRHIFLDAVKGKNPDLTRLHGALDALTMERIDEYSANLPEEWVVEGNATSRIVAYIKQLKTLSALTIDKITAALS